MDAVCREMILRDESSEVRGERIETVYLGGGTPSQLSIPQLEQLFIYINKVYFLTSHLSHLTPEITIEMNPDDVSVPYAESLSQLGINRVSMGAQTFDNERLRFLHRRHSAEQVCQAVNMLRVAGIKNISIDLMYGFPDESLEDWQRDIDAVLALDVEHISAYCLMIEEGTALYQKLHKGDGSFCVLSDGTTQKEPSPICDEELERQMYEMLMDKLTDAGYEHYEISNFAKPGFRSRHNSSYWHDVPYIGLGAAAHSYDEHYRSWNIADIHQYIVSIRCGELPSEREIIDEVTYYNDRITTALRTIDGLDLMILSAPFRSYCLKEAQPFLRSGQLQLCSERLSLTRQGLFVSDYIMSSLMYV